MSELLTNVITIRGVDYTVSEIDGKTMRTVRNYIKESPEKVETFLAWKCTVKPAFKSEEDALGSSHAISKAISEEAFRLSRLEDGAGEAKND